MAQEVKVKRTLLDTPTMDNPTRQMYMIEYHAGELPPAFVYLEKSKWTKEEEAKLIKADIKKRVEGGGGELITL